MKKDKAKEEEPKGKYKIKIYSSQIQEIDDLAVRRGALAPISGRKYKAPISRNRNLV